MLYWQPVMCWYVKMKLHIRCTPKERKIKVKTMGNISTLRALRQHFGNNEDISFSFRAAGIHELKRASESRWVQKVVRKPIDQS